MDAIKCWLQQLVDEALPVAAVTVPNCQILNSTGGLEGAGVRGADLTG